MAGMLGWNKNISKEILEWCPNVFLFLNDFNRNKKEIRLCKVPTKIDERIKLPLKPSYYFADGNEKALLRICDEIHDDFLSMKESLIKNKILRHRSDMIGRNPKFKLLDEECAALVAHKLFRWKIEIDPNLSDEDFTLDCYMKYIEEKENRKMKKQVLIDYEYDPIVPFEYFKKIPREEDNALTNYLKLIGNKEDVFGTEVYIDTPDSNLTNQEYYNQSNILDYSNSEDDSEISEISFDENEEVDRAKLDVDPSTNQFRVNIHNVLPGGESEDDESSEEFHNPLDEELDYDDYTSKSSTIESVQEEDLESSTEYLDP